MGLVFKIAWRNIVRHKGKSLIIGIILFLGALIMTLGNGALAGMDKGLRENMVNRFLGDLVVISTNQKNSSVFFTPMGEAVELLKGYTNIRGVLSARTEIERFLPVTRGAAMALSDDGPGGFTLLFGVKFDDYQRMFHTNVLVIEGRGIRDGERGVMMTTESRKALYDNTSHWSLPAGGIVVRTNLSPEARSNEASLLTKTNVVLMGFGNDGSTLDVSVPVRGVYRYRSLNKLWSFINLIDLESFRECFNYGTAADAAVELSKSEEKVFSAKAADDFSDLFEETTVNATVGRQAYDTSALRSKTKRSDKKLDLDAGSYNFVLIKLKSGVNAARAEKAFTAALRSAGVDGRAVGWKKAAGQIGDMTTIVRGALFFFVLFVYFVAAIIIMNTLSMNAIERTQEIGMMRAVGGTKGFIGRMFVTETFLLSFVFGGAGILLGVITVNVVAAFKISSTNEILQLLFGGDVFRPQTDPVGILLGILQLTIVTFISVIYPVMVARGITPLQAIARD